MPSSRTLVAIAAVAAALGGSLVARHASARQTQAETLSSSAVLAQLPDGDTKRQFIIDCTNCHQMTAALAYPDGKPRTRVQWTAIVQRMLQTSGATTGFPIMSAGRTADSTAAWLERYLTAPPAADANLETARATRIPSPNVVEYLLPQERDLAHDVGVDSAGRVIVTGMFTASMYVLDTITKQFSAIPIPVPSANPRAVEVAANGDWWVLLGGPGKVARYAPQTNTWATHDVGLYAHSVALGRDGRVWYNGHFTRDPEIIGYVDGSTGEKKTFELPRHPTMAAGPGGPIPYELRMAPDGFVWMTELQGHRVISLNTQDGATRVYQLPGTITAPRRLDIDTAGTVWIPTYGANSLVRLDPRTGATREFTLPRQDAVPYVARASRGTIWVGTNASDEVYAFDARTERWRVYPLPTPGAVIRHLVIDPRNGDVWLAFGGSPGIPARIARLRP